MDKTSDPFNEQRKKCPVLPCDFQGETVPMILRHADLREACKDWERYSSDAPFRVPIPSEEELRRMRQLPIEVDPPEHTEYRKIVEPFFKRPKDPEMIAKVEALINEFIDRARNQDSIEIVREFSLPIQSRALTYLLDMPEEEAEIWTGWGIHVFKDGEDEADCEQRGNVLEEYLDEAFDKAEADPGEDFFSALTKAEYQGRKLTRDEMMGFGDLTFAGGRDTIIHSISCVIAYLAKHPEAFDYLRESPKNIVAASEEFFRVVTPLTHIGRTCPVTTDVHGFEVKPKGRVSLCWSSANNDETVFENPHDIQLDRKPNPHVAFGFGKHLCLGAPHARLIIRTLLQKLCDRGVSLTIEEEVEHVEHEAEYTRVNGYDVLRVAVS